MLSLAASLLLIGLDQVIRRAALFRHWPLAPGGHLIHLAGQSYLVLVLGTLVYYASSEKRLGAYVPLFSGALSNMLSSLEAHGVIDYIPFGTFYSNGADLLVTGGAIWLTYCLLKR